MTRPLLFVRLPRYRRHLILIAAFILVAAGVTFLSLKLADAWGGP